MPKVTIKGEDGEEQVRVTYDLTVDDVKKPEFKEGSDLTPKVKVTLGSYLKTVSTDAKAQVYGPYKGVDSNLQAGTPIFNDLNNQSTPPLTSWKRKDGSYTYFETLAAMRVLGGNSVGDGDLIAKFQTLSDSQVFNGLLMGEGIQEASLGLKDFLNKADRSADNGSLLANISPAGGYRGSSPAVGGGKSGEKSYAQRGGFDHPSGKLQRRISAVLESNRWTPGPNTPFIDENSTSGIVSHAQGELGVYKSNEEAPEITFEQLRKVAVNLMIRATGHTPNIPNADETDTAGLILPSLNQQFGSRIDMTVMTAASAMADEKVFGVDANDLGKLKFQIPDSGIVGDQGGVNTLVFNDKTYGQLNSPDEPFNSAGMILTSAIALGSIIILAVLVNEIIKNSAFDESSFGRKGGPYTDDVNIGSTTLPSPLGQYGTFYHTKDFPKGRLGINAKPGGTGQYFKRALGIPDTRAHFDSALARGIQAFYGFTNATISDIASSQYAITGFAQVLEQAQNVLESPGYYATVMRHIARDVTTQVEQAPAMGTADGVVGAVNILRNFTSGAPWRFIMTMAGIGEAIVADKWRVFSPTPTDPEDSTVGDGLATVVYKSRVGGSQDTAKYRKLAWRNSSSPMLILPQTEARTAYNNYAKEYDPGSKAPPAVYSEGKTVIAPPDSIVGGRIKNKNTLDWVRTFEAELDTAYVPFYFHDLRTNEIISFHAFINTLTENFSPSYNATGGVGRIDDVQVYQKTARTLSLSFAIVATDKEDHDLMWLKISKLTSMLYPQWSHGTMVEDSSGKRFRMPFSQIPTASPVIRLRVGDVARSNYSRFGLSRIFGLGEPGVISAWNDAAGKKITASTIRERQKRAEEIVVKKSINAANLVGKYFTLAEKTHQTFNTGGQGKWPDGLKKDFILKATQAFRIDLKKDGAKKYRRKLIKQGTRILVTSDDKLELPGQGNPVKPSSGLAFELTFNHPKLNPSLGGPKLSPPSAKFTTTVTTFSKVWNYLDVDIPAMAHVFFRPEAQKEAIRQIKPGQKKDNTTVAQFMQGDENATGGYNPIVRAFEATSGQGLAGVITSFNIDHNQGTWETSMGSRAPKMVNIDIGFTVIHDITPGLDPTGGIRGPTHIVGDTMTSIAGHNLGPDIRMYREVIESKELEALISQPGEEAPQQSTGFGKVGNATQHGMTK